MTQIFITKSGEPTEPQYILGHTDAELARLIRQAAFYERQTRLHLCEAGLLPGHRVLDFGCGGGDVAFLAASMVGPNGTVVGVDRSAEAIQTSRVRARDLGLGNVDFLCTDDAGLLSQLVPQSFDAVIGRMVLMYQADPVACLRRLATLLRPGGLAMFQEVQMDLGWQGSVPKLVLFDKIWYWLSTACQKAGVALNMGLQLPGAMAAAGFATPTALLTSRVETGGESPVYDYLADTVRSLLPAILRFQIATEPEVEIDSLAERLRAEARSSSSVLIPSMLVGVFGRLTPVK